MTPDETAADALAEAVVDVPAHECCGACGFTWAAVTATEVIDRLATAAGGWRSLLRSGGATFATRGEPDVWSIVEYAAHVRDAGFNLRDRIVLGLVVPNPTPPAMFTDARIDNGLYAADTAERLAVEVPVALMLLARTVAALSPDQLARPIFYGWPRPTTRSLSWVAAQALHEAEHHLDDARRLAG